MNTHDLTPGNSERRRSPELERVERELMRTAEALISALRRGQDVEVRTLSLSMKETLRRLEELTD
jgi:hypothetical protein